MAVQKVETGQHKGLQDADHGKFLDLGTGYISMFK